LVEKKKHILKMVHFLPFGVFRLYL